jgi:threonine/homoserine/homoserine lactone efflux protein
MKTELSFLVTGALFGLSGGLSPGPLLMLVISETLKHGSRSGVKVAMAPLITDAPIVLLAITVVSQLRDIYFVLGLICLGGACFLVYLGYESIVFKGADLVVEGGRPQSLKKGVIANLLNPSPYLFWFSVGAPIVIKAAGAGFMEPVLFIGGMYLLLVGAKVVVAVLTGKSRRFLKSRGYVYSVRILGAVLLLFAALFVRDGLRFFGLL